MSTTHRDWSAYNEIKTRRFQTFLSLLLLVVDAMPLPSLYKGKGRKPIPIRDIIVCLAVKVYYKMSYRDAVSELKRHQEELKLAKVPHFNTLRKYMLDPRVTAMLGILLLLVVQPIAPLETVFASDATGFASSRKSEYYTVVIKGRKMVKENNATKLLQKKKKKDFVKMHITIGTVTQMVAAAVATIGKRHESTQLESMVKIVARIFSVKEWLGDSGYLARKACNLVARLGAQPFFWPKSNSTTKSRGSYAWSDMVELFRRNIEEFKRHYHQRSKVESVFSVIKEYFGDFVYSRRIEGQLNELLLKVFDYNLCRLGEVTFLMGVDIGRSLTPDNN